MVYVCSGTQATHVYVDVRNYKYMPSSVLGQSFAQVFSPTEPSRCPTRALKNITQNGFTYSSLNRNYLTFNSDV